MYSGNNSMEIGVPCPLCSYSVGVQGFVQFFVLGSLPL